ncbi:MAG: NAD-dependent succinate-semialdehyde dehydrogenase [Bacteroidales bacterium]
MPESVNPVTGEPIERYPEHTPSEINKIIEDTASAQQQWTQQGISERSKLMHRAAAFLRDNLEIYAYLITLEMGKPIVQSRAEVEKCARVCQYYADKAEGFLSNEFIATEASNSYIAYRPLGVVLAVMPWNFPFWQVFRFAAPALMSGNGALLKHASNVTGCALAIASVFQKAGFPESLFSVLKVPGKEVGKIIEHPYVKAVTLTGSVPAGRSIAAKAGEMLKKTVLELGGSDPYVILEDADLDAAIAHCVNSRLINSGQSCIAAKRFIAVKSICQQFEEGFTEVMKTKQMGNPMHEDTILGPQASLSLRDEVHKQVTNSIEKGAKCLLGGYIPDDKGAWYPATVLTNVKPGMPAYDEEVFGPVAAIIEAQNEADAIRIANDTDFGLGAAVFTDDKDHGQALAEKSLHAGSCFVNDFVKSDPRLPFGGIAHSGYGRELSYLGIREFTNIKTVYVK